jgi:hypothetical protein
MISQHSGLPRADTEFWGRSPRARCCRMQASSAALSPPFDRNDSPSPRSTTAAPHPRFEIEHLGLRAEPEPQKKVRPQQRDVMAGSAIDLDEIATPEILDPCQVEGLHSGLCSWYVLRADHGPGQRRLRLIHASARRLIRGSLARSPGESFGTQLLPRHAAQARPIRVSSPPSVRALYP